MDVTLQPSATSPGEPLRLRVPAPASRPGDAPKFTDLQLSRAGEMRRPAVDEREDDMLDLAYGLVRVLDIDGNAVGPWRDLLDVEQLKLGLRDMLTVRSFDR